MNTKPETLGERIRRIRGGMHQAEFGKKLGVGQGTVSAWERDDKRRLPSADIYFRLAAFAAKPEDQKFFLQKAGLSPEIIVSAANKLVKEQIVRPKEGEMVSIQPIQELEAEKQTPRPGIPFAETLGAKSAFVRYFTVDEQSAGYGLDAGDILLIDNTESGALDLSPFWDKMVLVEHDLTAKHFSERNLSPPIPPLVEYVAGWLVLKEHRLGAARMQSIYLAEIEPWLQDLLRPGDDYWSHLPPGHEYGAYLHTQRLYRHRQSEKHMDGAGSGKITIGRWEGESVRPLEPNEWWKENPSEVLGHARAEVRLLPGCRILGRVIGWFRPPSKGEK